MVYCPQEHIYMQRTVTRGSQEPIAELAERKAATVIDTAQRQLKSYGGHSVSEAIHLGGRGPETQS